MDRPDIYSLEQVRSYDIAWGWRSAMIGLGNACQAMIGTTNSALVGFAATQTAPSASLVINVQPGQIYAQAAIDATAWGPLTADANVIMQQGIYYGGTLTFNAGGLTSGQSQWVLVEVAFAQADIIPADDPNAGVLPYVNIQNPSQPLSGPGGSGATQDTQRIGEAIVQLKYGAPATTGDEVAPSPDANNAPLYLVLLTHGQTTITNGEILVAGPGVYSDYQYAPLFPGITGQIPNSTGSHHAGIAGQAAQIQLAFEVEGLLPLANMYVSNANPTGEGGDVTVGGEIPILTQLNVNPSGNLAGNATDMAFNSALGTLWVCTASGTTSTATWSEIGNPGLATYESANFTIAAGGNYYLCDTTAGGFTATLLPVASMGATTVYLENIGTNLLTITPHSGETINGLSASASMTLQPNQGVRLLPRTAGSVTIWYPAT